MNPLADLFPDGDYRFHLTLRRGEPRAFFAPQDASGQVLAERRRCLAAEPARYAALQKEGESAFAEFAALCAAWGVRATSGVTELGGALEPDFLLMVRDDAGRFRLRGGALCFPTGWALEEKLGETMGFIHGVVPGLNAAIGAQIEQFLDRLKPGAAFLRDNWGLAASEELNLHPARGIAPPALPLLLERLWLRVEHQALFALPETRSVAFGIRIALHRLDEVANDAAVRTGLTRALQTMSEELARYKRLDGIRAELIRRL
jgi:hypothetical protein